MRHIREPLVGFGTVGSIESMLAEAIPQYSRPTRRFPIRYLRYWFMRRQLWKLYRELGRPLDVLEVGVGYGKMLAFMEGPSNGDDTRALPEWIATWDALSIKADPKILRRYSYSNFHSADLEQDFQVPALRYDAVIILHVLEHLTDPESVMLRPLPALRPGGFLMGGSPTMPEGIGRLHEKWLRRKNARLIADVRSHRHVAVISPRRMRRFARSSGLEIDLMAGAFLLRSSRNPLEDYSWWTRLNLAWGALLPSLGGEVYFALRKCRAILLAGLAGVSLEAAI